MLGCGTLFVWRVPEFQCNVSDCQCSVFVVCTVSPEDIARQLLDANRASLESTTRKIVQLCTHELEVMAVNGCMHGDGRLRACLILAASLIHLDIQEVEGLNSMIKMAVHRSNNNRLTLQLLTSRVCLRKLISLHTAGASSTGRYKDVVPAAAALARSAFLYNDIGQELVADSERWQACQEVPLVRGDPAVYNPELVPKPAHLWAMKYNTQFMRQVKAHQKDPGRSRDSMLALVIPAVGYCTASECDSRLDMWVVCGVTRSQAMLLKVCHLQGDGGTVSIDTSSSFEFSVELIASTYSRVETDAKARKMQRLTIYSQVLRVMDSRPNTNAVGTCLKLEGDPVPVCELRARYQRKEGACEAALLNDGSDSDDEGNAGGVNPMDNEDMMRMLHGLDDLPEASGDDKANEDASDDASEADDEDMRGLRGLSQLDDLNIKLAATAVNQQSAADSEHLHARVAGRVSLASDVSPLCPVDEETEAILQEVLLSSEQTLSTVAQSQNRSDTQAHGTESSHASADVKMQGCTSAGPASAMADLDMFCEGWKKAARASCNALVFRDKSSSRSLGDGSSLGRKECHVTR